MSYLDKLMVLHVIALILIGISVSGFLYALAAIVLVLDDEEDE